MPSKCWRHFKLMTQRGPVPLRGWEPPMRFQGSQRRLTDLRNTHTATMTKYWFFLACVRNFCTRGTCKVLNGAPTNTVKYFREESSIFWSLLGKHTQSWCWNAFNQDSVLPFGFSSCQHISCHFYLTASENCLAEFENYKMGVGGFSAAKAGAGV